MQLYITKLYVFLLLTLCRLISGLSPLFVSKKFKRKYGLENVTKTWVERSVSYSMDFSGGILLATCFIHMIPEVRHHLVETLKDDYRFPYTETLVCVGFFIVFVLEQSVIQVAQLKSSHHGCGSKKSKSDALIPVKVTDARCKDERERELCADISGDGTSNGISPVVAANNGLILEMNSTKDDPNECNNNTKTNKSHNLKNLLLVSALSFHSVMEGLAIGLEQDSEAVWYLFLAVTIHECTILFCVGIEMVVSSLSPAIVITYMAVFALVSPAGVLFGTLFTLSVSSKDPSSFQLVTISSLQGLAAGTILYVTFFEVLNNHKHHHHHRGETHQSKSGLPKLIFIALGFIFMVVLELIGGHNNETSECYSHEHFISNNKSSF